MKTLSANYLSRLNKLFVHPEKLDYLTGVLRRGGNNLLRIAENFNLEGA